jgi:hypothetical protein
VASYCASDPSAPLAFAPGLCCTRRALKGRDAVIATKFGFTYRQDRDDFDEITGTDGSPANARRVAEASLKRLGREVIDLYYLHRAGADVPIEETVGAMAELVAEGKIRAIGLSAVSAAPMRCNRSWRCKASIRSGHALRMLSPALSASATFVHGFAAPGQSDGTAIKYRAPPCCKAAWRPSWV